MEWQHLHSCIGCGLSRSSPILLWYQDPSRAPRKLSFDRKANVFLGLDDDTAVIGFERDGPLEVWNLKSGTKVRSLQGALASCSCLVLIRPGMLAAGYAFRNPHGYENVVGIIDINTGECLQHLTGHLSQINAIAFTSDVLLSACEGRRLRVWTPDAEWNVRRFNYRACSWRCDSVRSADSPSFACLSSP